MKPSGVWFLERTWSRRRGAEVREASRRPRGRGVRPPPERALHPRGPLVVPLTDFFRLYISIYPRNIGEQSRSGVPPPEASIAIKNQSRPVSAPCQRGEIPLRWPSSSSRCSPWRGGSSSPSGLRVCTSSYVFDLSLSLSCSWGGTILMYPELCYYSWILWCFSPLLSCNGLSFPFEVILLDWVFKDLRTLDVCLGVLICGDNRISRDPLDVCFGDQLAGSVTMGIYV